MDFYLFGFTVDFGATNQSPDPLNLIEFWEMLHKPGPSSAPLDQGADPNPIRGYLAYNEYDIKGNERIKRTKTKDGKPLPILVPEDGAAMKFVLENGNYPMPSTVTTPTTSNATPPNTGAGAKWFVRGGSFSFRIVSDFAMSQATIAAPNDGEETPITANAPSTTKPIYARPMRVTTGVTSTLTVTIHEKDSPYTVIGGWQSVQFALKPVPTAAWGIYSSALDPLFTPNPTDLLNGGTDATTPLAMALMVSAPPPELAPSTIPVFSATAAAKFGILDFRTDKLHGTDWILAPPKPKQTLYLASPLTAAENALVAANQLDKLWDERQKQWQDAAAKANVAVEQGDGSLGVYQTITIISRITELFAWDQKRPQTEPVTSPPVWLLNGQAPTKLIQNMKNTYLALPRVAVS